MHLLWGCAAQPPHPKPWPQGQLRQSCGLGPGQLQGSAPYAVLVISFLKNMLDFTASSGARFGLLTFLPVHAAVLEVPSPANTNHDFPLPLQPVQLYLFLEGSLGADFGRGTGPEWILFGPCSSAQARPERA